MLTVNTHTLRANHITQDTHMNHIIQKLENTTDINLTKEAKRKLMHLGLTQGDLTDLSKIKLAK